MRKAFLAGWPVSHSKSPQLHSFWLAEMGIEGSYEAIPVEPESLVSFLSDQASQGFVGGNVTIPHKEHVFQLSENADEDATKIGAANTIWFENGKMRSTNTDAYGFAANLDEHTPHWTDGETAVVLGAGGASRAVIHAIVKAGYSKVLIVNRTIERAKELENRFGNCCSAYNWQELPKLLGQVDLLVNTTSLGMQGSDQVFPVPLDGLSSASIVTDIVYTPLETPLLKAANQRGNPTVDGLGMLLHQAVPGFEIWFGKRPEVTHELRRHLIRADEERTNGS